MKKFFLLAAAAVMVFASCAKSDQPEVSKDKAIGFKSYTGRTVTKADADFFIPKAQTWLNAQSFGVYAYNSANAVFAQADIASYGKFMTNQKVDFTGNEADERDPDAYTYTPTRYWPNDGANNLLSFWAYYPYEALTKGFEANTFTVGTDPTKMVDLLVSDVKNDMQYTAQNKGIVPFTFHHALTMVKFAVKTDDNDGDHYPSDVVIKLEELTVNGVKVNGTITPSYTAGTTTYEWAVTGDATPFKVCETATALNEEVQYFPTNDEVEAAYLMIPHTDITAVKATIKYSVTVGSDDPVVNTAEVDLKTTEVATWAQNMNILYTFTVGLKPIKFTATVVPWEDEVVSGITL